METKPILTDEEIRKISIKVAEQMGHTKDLVGNMVKWQIMFAQLAAQKAVEKAHERHTHLSCDICAKNYKAARQEGAQAERERWKKALSDEYKETSDYIFQEEKDGINHSARHGFYVYFDGLKEKLKEQGVEI